MKKCDLCGNVSVGDLSLGQDSSIVRADKNLSRVY